MKKLLIVSQNSLSLHANNGKTLTNIFQKWHKDSLAQLYFQDEIPESLKFDNFYRIRDIDLVNKLFNPSKSCLSKPIALKWVDNHYFQRSKFFLSFIRVIKKTGFLKDLLREILYKFDFLYINDLKKELSFFKPEAIFFVISDYTFTIDIALKLSKDLKIPFYIYILDDRYMMIKRNSFSLFFNGIYLKKFERAVKESAGCFCIGHSMAANYKKLFNKHFEVLSNPVDLTTIKFINKSYKKNQNYYRILYAGGVTLGRFDSILNLARVLKNVEEENNISIDFLVCSGDVLSKGQLKELKNLSIKFLGKLNYCDLDKLYETVDFITHIESNQNKYMKFTNLSISTKIPECLAKGICLIGYGPSKISSMKLIHDNQLGCYVDNDLSFEAQCQAIKNFINSPLLCNQFVANGKIFAQNNFSQDFISKKIISIINN